LRFLISTRGIESPGGFTHDAIERNFYDMFEGHEITALLNISPDKQDIEKLADINDALILSGGDDNPERLRTEIYAIACFNEKKKPVLGICHGGFLLTHIYNGKMIDVDGHRKTRHSILYKYNNRTVNSYHGSAILEPPVNSEVLVKDEDNYVESWILDNTAVVIWHPERENDFWMPDEIKQLLGVK